METSKPHLLAIEDAIQNIQHGEVTVRIEVRGGNVEKMQFIDEKKNWLRDKRPAQEVIIAGFVRSIY